MLTIRTHQDTPQHTTWYSTPPFSHVSIAGPTWGTMRPSLGRHPEVLCSPFPPALICWFGRGGVKHGFLLESSGRWGDEDWCVRHWGKGEGGGGWHKAWGGGGVEVALAYPPISNNCPLQSKTIVSLGNKNFCA